MPHDFAVCYAFSENLSHVVTILKTHPEPLAGKLNGLGGSFDPEEGDTDTLDTAVREFTGEGNIETAREEWIFVESFKNENGKDIDVYCTKGDKFLKAEKVIQKDPSKTEEIFVLSLAEVLVKDNLVPHMIDHLQRSIELLYPKAA